MLVTETETLLGSSPIHLEILSRNWQAFRKYSPAFCCCLIILHTLLFIPRLRYNYYTYLTYTPFILQTGFEPA